MVMFLAPAGATDEMTMSTPSWVALSEVVEALIPVPEKETAAPERKLVPLRTMDTESP